MQWEMEVHALIHLLLYNTLKSEIEDGGEGLEEPGWVEKTWKTGIFFREQAGIFSNKKNSM